MGFGGGRKSAPEPEPVVEPVEKVDKRDEEAAAALRARRKKGGTRALLSPTRENTQTGLASKLGGTE